MAAPSPIVFAGYQQVSGGTAYVQGSAPPATFVTAYSHPAAAIQGATYVQGASAAAPAPVAYSSYPTSQFAQGTPTVVAHGGSVPAPLQLTPLTPVRVTSSVGGGAIYMQAPAFHAPTPVYHGGLQHMATAPFMGAPVAPVVAATPLTTVQAQYTPRVWQSNPYATYSAPVMHFSSTSYPQFKSSALVLQSQQLDLKLDKSKIGVAVRTTEVLGKYAAAYFTRGDLNKDKFLTIEELGPLLESLFQDIEAQLPTDADEKTQFFNNRLRKFDRDGDSKLSQLEFTDLLRFTLLQRFEELNPPKFRRSDSIGEAHKGAPNQFYTIDKQLGAGAFGIVHLVESKASKLKCVMKTINKDRAAESGTPIAMLKQEIETLVLLDHPHILRLFEWYSDHHNIYLILDICAGGELLDLLKESVDHGFHIPEGWIQRIFVQTLEAIGYCHSKGVMHKDLKFENLMLEKKLSASSSINEIHVVVIDVGLAELFGAKHHKAARSKMVAGSLATMAPEVLLGDFTYKCDVWSLGCMLFAIFNSSSFYIPDGKGGQVLYPYPFFPEATEADPSGTQNFLQAQYKGPNMSQVAGASKSAQDLIVRMLHPLEAQRPDCKGCLAHPWLAQELSLQHSSKPIPAAHLGALLQEHENQRLWRATACQAASHLPATKVQELMETFKSLDTDNDGSVSKAELVQGLLKLNVPKEAAEHAADMADLDGDGNIEFSEFVATCLPSSKELFAVALQVAFSQFDVDHDGSLDKNEVAQLLTGGHVSGLNMPSSKSVEEILNELDADHNGRITFAEFHDYFMTHEAH